MPAQPDWSTIRQEFPTLENKTYLNSCSLGLLSKRTRGALTEYMDLWMNSGAAAWYAEWPVEIAAVREEFARLINASPGEIAILPNISSCLTAILSSLDLSEGDQVVTSNLDFPTIAHNFLAKERLGVESTVIQAPDRVKVDLDQFGNAITDRTVLVATSRVYFTSGYIQDVAAITEMAHQKGALMLLDDYQATGQVPIDVKETNVDVLVSGGLKWLLGGPGIAYMYVREELIERLTPTMTGWFAHRDQFSFDPNEMIFRDDAARFEAGTPSVAAIYTGAEGLRIVNEIGADAIRERTAELTDYLVKRLREEGYSLRVPDDDSRHASITMVEMDDPASAVGALAEQNIVVDFRPGAMRVSPYFYNTIEDIDMIVDALRRHRDSS